MTRNTKSVAVVGLGYVGLPLALLADRKGYKTYGIDIDANKIEKLSKRIAPYKDIFIQRELRKSAMTPTSDFSKVRDVGIVIICVPTPVYANHMPNLEPVQKACECVAPYIHKNQLVVLESTVNPGVCESIVIPILEEGSGLTAGEDFYIAHCPERINPGDKKWNVENIPRVVGSLEEKGLKLAKDFYESILTAKVKKMKSLKEAEAVKIVENSFRDINIAFVNELARSFAKLGIDVVNVIDGASTKPFAFMAHYPGCGVGGHCIPVDPYYLIQYAKENGFQHKFLELARRINNEMPDYTADLVEDGLNERNIPIEGANVAVLGLAYKKNIDDCRESPSFEIIRHLEELGANVKVFDPYVKDKSTVSSLEEALEETDAVVIATDHREFTRLSPQEFISNNVGVIVDGRNCLNEEPFVSSGIVYKSIGR
jgi:UDP-N-acetyl-D-glucosamine dehydrogenase